MERFIERNPTGDQACEYIKKSFELKNHKLYKEAIEMLYKALGCEDIGERTVEVTSQIGDLYFLLKNYDRAIEQYEKALEADKLHSHSLFQLCEIYFIQNNFEKALELIKELCENSKELKNYIYYFKILLKMNLHAQMRDLYMAIEDSEISQNDEILYMLSQTDFDNREKYLKVTIARNPEHTGAYFDLGVIYYERDEIKEAKECFKKIIGKDKTFAPALYHMGLIEQKSGNFTKAIEYFLKATKIEAQNGEYFFDLAKAYTDVAWYDEAQTAANEALRLLRAQKPLGNFDEHHFLLGWIAIQKRDFKSALVYLEQISASSTITNEANALKGLIALEEGDLAQAKAILEECCKKGEDASKNAILMSALGRTYKELKLFDNAVKIYEDAVLAHTNSQEFMNELINILIDRKDYDKATKYALDFKKKNPKNPKVYNSLARIFYRQGKLEDALSSLKKLNSLSPHDPEARYFTGLALNDLSCGREAVETLSIALELNPNAPKYYAQLARAYALIEDYKSAMIFIKEAIGLAPEELGYFELALKISEQINDKSAVKFFSSKIKRLEKVLRGR